MPCLSGNSRATPLLTIALSPLPTLQKIINDFRFGRLTNLLQIHLDSIVRVPDERTFGKFYRNVCIRRTKTVSERFLLDWLDQQKIQKRLCGFALFFRTPRSVNNVVRI